MRRRARLWFWTCSGLGWIGVEGDKLKTRPTASRWACSGVAPDLQAGVGLSPDLRWVDLVARVVVGNQPYRLFQVQRSRRSIFVWADLSFFMKMQE